MEKIYKNVLSLVRSLTQLSETTYVFKEDPTEAKGEKIVEIVDKCENNFLKVKEEVVRMIRVVEESTSTEKIEENHEIKVIQTEKGFLIKE